jgi:hypothetical protein
MIGPQSDRFFVAVLQRTGFYNVSGQPQSEIKLNHVAIGICLEIEDHRYFKLVMCVENPAIFFDFFPFNEKIVGGRKDGRFVFSLLRTTPGAV